jgi:hypothetical protein
MPKESYGSGKKAEQRISGIPRIFPEISHL